jgi:hypothetical protein
VLLLLVLSVPLTDGAAAAVRVGPTAGRAMQDDGGQRAQDERAKSAVDTEDTPTKEELEEGYKYQPEDGRSYYSLYLPDPIRKREWERYAKMLILADAQEELFAKLHAAYLREDWRFRKKEVEPLYERSSEISTKGDLYENLDTAADYVELRRDERQVLNPLVAIEARMFTQLEPYLTDDQLVRLERVRSQRVRIRCRAEGGDFPAGKLDLGWAIGDLTDAGIDFTPHDPEAFDAILWAYDMAMTPLCEQRYEKAIRISQHGVPLRVESMVLSASADGDERVRERARALQEQYHEYNRAYVVMARRIHDLNRRYLGLFAGQLPDEAGEALVKWFREKAYPVIFPDPYDFADALEKAAQIETLSPEERKGVRAVGIVYEQQHEAICDRMIDAYLDWHVEIDTLSGYEFEPYEAYKTKMRDLQTKRKEAAEVACSLLEGLVTTEEMGSLGAAMERWRKSALAFEQREERMMEQYGFVIEWPGPYD